VGVLAKKWPDKIYHTLAHNTIDCNFLHQLPVEPRTVLSIPDPFLPSVQKIKSN